MKTLITALAIVMAITEIVFSQNVNWRSVRAEQPNILQLNAGYDFGVTTQFGYYRTFTLIKPIAFGLDFSLPMGDDLLDDFKVKLGGQVEIVEADGFSMAIKVQSIFRRHQTALVRIVSFGADLGIVAGYYKSTWYAAGEFGFDKAVTTHLKNSDIMRTYFPAIKDGWYIPTAGHFYYGIQGGKSLGENLDLSVRIGFTNAHDDQENAVIPYYAQLGVGMSF